MTDEEVLAKYQKMEEIFGTLPSHIHEPLQFAHLVKLYLRRFEDKNDPRIS